MPGARAAVGLEPYALFLFCGILPWTWFASSLVESSTVLITSGNLLRKVLFPAEVLPVVTVFAGLAHFSFGLPILAAFFLYYGAPVHAPDLLWLPLVVLVQLVLTLGLAFLVSALTVHFRDLRDLLANLVTLWFWATPIVYHVSMVPDSLRPLVVLNPFTHLAVAYQEVLIVDGPFREWPRLIALGGIALAVFVVGYFVFDRLRDTLAEEV
jgi:lipopolysaccharide transport system permease protein